MKTARVAGVIAAAGEYPEQDGIVWNIHGDLLGKAAPFLDFRRVLAAAVTVARSLVRDGRQGFWQCQSFFRAMRIPTCADALHRDEAALDRVMKKWQEAGYGVVAADDFDHHGLARPGIDVDFRS